MLVPVDWSARSERALAYTCELAASASAEIDVLHVVRGPGQLRSAVDGYLGRALPHANGAAWRRAATAQSAKYCSAVSRTRWSRARAAQS